MSTVLSLNDSLAAKGQLQTSRIFQVVMTAMIVYETVLATLAGIHLSPEGSLTCALRERWEEMFRGKDEEGIRRIQDAFECCGFRSVRDMAWPFPDKGHGSEVCAVRFERSGACVEPWKMEERKVAIMLLVVAVAVFVWQVSFMMTVLNRRSEVLTLRVILGGYDPRTLFRLGMASIRCPFAGRRRRRRQQQRSGRITTTSRDRVP